MKFIIIPHFTYFLTIVNKNIIKYLINKLNIHTL